MKEVSLKDLLEAGCHFGHKTNKWNPKASKFIYKPVGDTHIIDLAQTKQRLEKAGQFIMDSVASGKEIIFVGTKRQASAIIKEEAEKIGVHYMSQRWIGGLITNWNEVKKNIDKLKKLKEQLSNKKEASRYTKLERLLMERHMNKLASVYGGVINLSKLPDILFVVDTRKESTAVAEALQHKKPVVGVVDSNTDPTNISYPIPANDDAVGSIQFIVQYIAKAYEEGKKKYAINAEKEEKKKQAEKAKAEKEEKAKAKASKKNAVKAKKS